MSEQTKEALLLVDIQNDFCEGGALEVPDSNQIFPVVNDWIKKAQDKGWPIIASRDWHPVDHISFEHRGGDWPVHCVQDSKGAEYHPYMQLPGDAVRVSKGTRFEKDAYSVFDGTDFDAFLERRGVETLYVVGLALDVCVRATVLEALENDFKIVLVTEGTRAVEADNTEKVLKELEDAGAQLRKN